MAMPKASACMRLLTRDPLGVWPAARSKENRRARTAPADQAGVPLNAYVPG